MKEYLKSSFPYIEVCQQTKLRVKWRWEISLHGDAQHHITPNGLYWSEFNEILTHFLE